MTRWLSRLLGLIGMVWVVRMLWVQHGQQSRTIRRFNRSMLNPILLPFAGRAGIPCAVLCHIGRHSGQSYTTPLLVQSIEQGWVIPLTYGEKADWYRNIKKAGGCTLLWQGRRYRARKPERLDVAQASPLFPPGLRLALRFAGIRQFVRLTSV